MVQPESLQKYALFGGLTVEQIQVCLKFMLEENLDAGVEIIREGGPCDRIRFILKGRVAVVKRGKLLSELGEGDSFGEMEVLDIMPSEADIHTLVPTQVLSLSNRNFHHIYKEDLLTFSMLTMNLARDLSRRLRRMNNIVVSGEANVKHSPVNDWG
jgi:CRP-like cAMP-binding protein